MAFSRTHRTYGNILVDMRTRIFKVLPMLHEALTLSCNRCVTFASHRQALRIAYVLQVAPVLFATFLISAPFFLSFSLHYGNKNGLGHSEKVKHHKIKAALWKATRRGRRGSEMLANALWPSTAVQ